MFCSYSASAPIFDFVSTLNTWTDLPANVSDDWSIASLIVVLGLKWIDEMGLSLACCYSHLHDSTLGYAGNERIVILSIWLTSFLMINLGTWTYMHWYLNFRSHIVHLYWILYIDCFLIKAALNRPMQSGLTVNCKMSGCHAKPIFGETFRQGVQIAQHSVTRAYCLQYTSFWPTYQANDPAIVDEMRVCCLCHCYGSRHGFHGCFSAC